MKNALSLFLFFASLLLTVLPTSAEDEKGGKKIRVAYDEWPPYMGTELSNRGFSCELAVTLLSKLNYKIEWIPTTTAEALTLLRDGKADLHPAFWKTKERQEFVSYTSPYESNRLVIISSKRKLKPYQSLDDLAGHKVGLAKGYGYPDSIKNSSIFTKIEAENFSANLSKLIKGEIDATIGDYFVALYTAAADFPSGGDSLLFSNQSLTTKDLHLVVSKQNSDHEDLVNSLNQELEKLMKDGTYQEILKKHGLLLTP